MSQLEVDKVIPQSGTTLTLGESGDTITIASGATFTPTLTAPIIDEINDTNGNEEIIFTTTASAVNELTIANAATGNAPEIAATGDDTDIDLKLTPKGAGNLVLDGIEFPNADGTVDQVLQTNGSGVLSFGTISSYTNSDALTLFNASGSAPVYACRAWVNFNGTGTPAIRADGNVTSITDNGTGDFTVNFTTAMQDANYAAKANACIGDLSSYINIVDFNAPTTSSIRFQTKFHDTATEIGSGTTFDYAYNFVAIFR
jgi:hypothetical protein